MPKNNGKGQRVKPQLQGHGKRLADKLRDAPVGIFERRAEIAVADVRQVIDILDKKRFVEPVVGVKLRQHLRVDAFFPAEGPPRSKPDEEKSNGDDDQQRRDCFEKKPF